MGIDKDSFVSALLNGYGYPAVGAFPDTFSFGGQNLTTESYDPDGAKKGSGGSWMGGFRW